MSDQQLQTAIKAQGIIDIDRAVKEMKGSALARSNWEQLISSAPIALRCLGACFMAANSKGTRDVQVPRIPGATLQRPLELSANLVHCANLGTDAFLTASMGMTEIYQISHASENKVYDIVELLGDRNAAAKQLPNSLHMLQSAADNCYQASKRIDDRFASWLLFVQELYEACQSRSGVAANESARAITEKAVATQRVTDTTEQIESTKKSMGELGKTLDASRKAFTKASESQPTGWDLIGQELVKGLGEAVIGGINSVINKNVNKNSGNQQTSTTSQGTQSSAPIGTSTSTTSDLAYSYVSKDLYLYNLLKPMVKNAGGDVDWDLASGGASSSKGGNSGASFIEAMLTLSRDAFNQQSGNGLATTTYKKVLDDAIKIVGELNKALKDSSTNTNASRPQKGSETVVRWQTLTESLYQNVYMLKLQGQNSAFSPSTSNGVISDPNLQTPEINARASHGRALLQAAAANLKTTADTLESTNKLYGENAKRLSDQQSSLMQINATLTRLTADVISLEESREILLQCIGLIIQLKARIVDLVNFFGTLSTVITTVSTKLMRQWLETVKTAVTGNPNSGAAGTALKVGQFSLESTERTMIMNGSLTIAAYFSFFADIANTWRGVFERSIHPGIELAQSLDIGGDAKTKMAKLDMWSKDAAEHIKTICENKRREIQDSMEEHVSRVRDSLQRLPPPPAAIEEITQKVLPAIQKADVAAIEADNNNSAVTILAGKQRAL